MDTYETNCTGEEPETNPQSASEPTPVTHPKKPSPFADSPYVMDHPPYTGPSQTQYQSSTHTASQKKRPGRVWKVVLSCLLIAGLVAGGCGITAYSINRQWQQRNVHTIQALNQLYDQIQDLEQKIEDNSYTGNGNSISGSTNTSVDGMAPGQIYAKCADSVVAIVAQAAQSASSGSGFIISQDGYILTNYHVVEGAATITVTIHDATEHTAKTIGYDDTNDLALIKIDATDLPAANLGSSDDLIVGDQVVAIGNPLGELTSTLTVGYISAKERDVTTDGTIINMLQTDAAINAGNSGGPLFNMKGQVVGIITAKYSGSTPSGASIEGIGFAIPIDDVIDKIQELKENGYVSTPYMGVSVDNRSEGIGAYVASVEPDGGAKAAGVQAGDVIVALGNHNIGSVGDISKALRNFKVGDTTTITVYRNRQVLELTITFGEKPNTSTQLPSGESQAPSGESKLPEDNSFSDWWEHFFGNGN